MKVTHRLFASAVTKAGYLNPLAPTGLTGVLTHPAPRPALIFTYTATLDKLRKLPESSVYRQSTEALTKHRLAIVEAVQPAGYDEWRSRLDAQLAANPDIFGPHGTARKVTRGGKDFIVSQRKEIVDDRVAEWDGEVGGMRGEGPRTSEERAGQAEDLGNGQEVEAFQKEAVELEDEPSLTAAQVADIEMQIGAGLIEEVIEVAEAELGLVDTMTESRVWEELEEKPNDGQWTYYARDRNTGKTQAPPPA